MREKMLVDFFVLSLSFSLSLSLSPFFLPFLSLPFNFRYYIQKSMKGFIFYIRFIMGKRTSVKWMKLRLEGENRGKEKKREEEQKSHINTYIGKEQEISGENNNTRVGKCIFQPSLFLSLFSTFFPPLT